MKILAIVFLFLTLGISSGNEEKHAVFYACQPGTGDYCSGYADGLEAAGENPNNWAGNYNKCVKKRGCHDLVVHDPNQP